MKYRVKLQYPWVKYYEVEVEVEAANVDDAGEIALQMERDDPTGQFWEKAIDLDGEAGDTEVWEVIPVDE